ncbi:MAG: SGNH hydrolase domain-containing protein, partial [Allosphingosinicella sp.]
ELALKPACLSAAAPPDQRRVLLWGDSFAGHYEGAFARLKDRLPFAIAIEADAGCPPMFGLGLRFNPGCRRAIEGIPALIDRAGVDIVILSARWEAQRGGLRTDLVEATVRRLRARGVTVILFGQSPVFPFNHPDEYHFREVRRGASPHSGQADNVAPEQLNHLLGDLARSTGAYFFDPAPALCRERSCLYRQEGDYLFREASHLTDRGALKVLGLFLSSPDFGAEGRLWRATPGPALPSDLSPGSNGPGSNVDAPGRDSG